MTTTIVFDHRGRTKKGRQGPLEVRIINERKVYYVNTGIKVLKSQWRFGEIVDCPDAEEKMNQLSAVERAVSAEVAACLTSHRAIDVSEIRRAVWGCSHDQANLTTFVDWYEDEYARMNVAEGTRAHYKTVLARLRECAILNKWEDLTAENVLRFDEYLRGLKRSANYLEKRSRLPSARLSVGAIYNHHKCVKAMISRAVTVGKVQSNPYDRLKGRFARGDKETVSYLTEDEVAAFCALCPPAGSVMAVAHDLFVFQLYTGLSYGDTQRFSIADYKQVAGRWVNIGTRIKTGVPYVSQLLPPAVEVLEQYNFQLPRIDNQTYNVQLKALATAAGINTRLHSHVARHTFATWMLKNGVKIENVSRMLGHTNITQTQRYAKVLAESVHDDFDRIEQLLTNKKNDEKTTTNGSDSPGAGCL